MPFDFINVYRSLKERFESGDEPSQKDRAIGLIPSTVVMISGCRDSQTSADVCNVEQFCLPDTAGKAGGAFTSALLRVLYHDEQTPESDMSYIQVLEGIRDQLDDDYTQVPQLSSSRPSDLDSPFVLAEGEGTRQALLIGINYAGHNPGELSGCHNDVMNIKKYIMEVHGFEEDNIVVLMDDGEHVEPTGENILRELSRLAGESESGDSVFVHYSGHGASVKDDDDGEEADGMDECLCPIDYAENGVIRDDSLYSSLIATMNSGVYVTCLMDCCHSGSILDLPYMYKPDGSTGGQLVENPKFRFDKLFQLFGNIASDFLDILQ
mmetsp:Transcript_10865/g.23867  ORF Transcript_10865/g.23867 Transcript_10865/m.23867 type:complete len:323 (-) Transcript_10865:489-1457(-)|eukprot:CAMPEP_0113310768 /NCGR_PEP_ID=MMETSP0010_2-20120614/8283_1 /TAXON_ID=216773 ORGANISM="Corethron hystrix, Strain 308" /NCGR_SAMPLE_ID=MMETSP0010_2 /ASSEMBLY_ACC=CAM_ASM_000155 /LENGTH=322 /DNA_ID=CAMNT_0000166293 /DNA_START=120 /DNA_END=1088 /DNA_ORIENTATION=+ /assembly_acc=CAM_ASM_000155